MSVGSGAADTAVKDHVSVFNLPSSQDEGAAIDATFLELCDLRNRGSVVGYRYRKMVSHFVFSRYLPLRKCEWMKFWCGESKFIPIWVFRIPGLSKTVWYMIFEADHVRGQTLEAQQKHLRRNYLRLMPRISRFYISQVRH
jgi:hypothetical protein